MEPTLPSTNPLQQEQGFCLPPQDRADLAEQQLDSVSAMLSELDEAASANSIQAKMNAAHQDRLALARLGVAGSLFTALRVRHAPSAAHCLRVAIGCSSWASALDMEEEDRMTLEAGALLHDIGKIGVPEAILLKPGKLDAEEAAIMSRHSSEALEILNRCTNSQQLLEIVRYAPAWFDGSQGGFDLKGNQLPLGARMVAVVDAFDSMTTDHVYRRAMSRERAMSVLFEFAGTQFDPQMVQSYCGLLSEERVGLDAHVVKRWLNELAPGQSNSLWTLGQPSVTSTEVQTNPFQNTLLENLHDGVAFVDGNFRILHWNRQAERITGIPASGLAERRWEPELVELWDEEFNPIVEENCPLRLAVASGEQSLRRLSLRGRTGERITIDSHCLPVFSQEGKTIGAAFVLHDASSQVTLEQRVQNLHVKAASDPLTKVANRAEFDRVHAEFVEKHLASGLPCSLIMCDIDFFKSVNDNFGHQAGDEALISFSSLLRRHCRVGDLVARYGGEEFVMLCADCDNATATRKAEQIRQELELHPQSMLNGKCITASFGVTELQAGDIAETMLRRADRALLQAKDLGRNRVVQLGSGFSESEAEAAPRGWFPWFQKAAPERLLQRELVTAVPLNIVAEKLKGFVADHHAEIISIERNRVTLKIEGQQRRASDRIVPFVAELQFDDSPLENTKAGGSHKTRIQVLIRPIRNRDRRLSDLDERAKQLLTSLKSYLVAQDYIPAVSHAARGEETKSS